MTEYEIMSREEVELVHLLAKKRMDGCLHLILFIGGYAIADPHILALVGLTLAVPAYYFFFAMKKSFSYVRLSQDRIDELAGHPETREILEEVKALGRLMTYGEYCEALEILEEDEYSH